MPYVTKRTISSTSASCSASSSRARLGSAARRVLALGAARTAETSGSDATTRASSRSRARVDRDMACARGYANCASYSSVRASLSVARARRRVDLKTNRATYSDRSRSTLANARKMALAFNSISSHSFTGSLNTVIAPPAPIHWSSPAGRRC